MKLPLKFLLRLAFTLAILGLILWKLGGLGEVSRLVLQMKPGYMLLALAVITLDRAWMNYKWIQLLHSRGIHLPFFRGLRIYCASMIWGMFLPATMGADAIRAYSTTRAGVDSNEIVASILIERTIGFLSALLLGLLSLLLLFKLVRLDARLRLVWWGVAALLLVGLAIFAASFNQRAFEFIYSRLLGRYRNHRLVLRLRLFHETYLAYQADKKILLVFFGLTFGEQFLPILQSWLIALGMNIQANLLYIAGAVPLTILIARIPISIDGLGVYDAVFALLMTLAGISPAQAVAISLAGRVLQIAAWLPWWAAHVIDRGDLQPPDNLQPTQQTIRETLIEEK